MLREVVFGKPAGPVRKRIAPETASLVRQLVLTLPLEDGLKAEMLRPVMRDAVSIGSVKKGWFIMIYPAQFSWVYDELKKDPHKAQLCRDVWCHIPQFVRMDTGEICQTRAQFAASHGCSLNDMSRVMLALEKVGAIKRVRDGRHVRYFLNPYVGTHVADEASREVSRVGWKQPSLFEVVEGDRK